MSALITLRKLMPPPADPTGDRDGKRWAQMEGKLGIQFPSDYREFCYAYGTGTLADPGRVMLMILNPLSENFDTELESQCSSFREYKEANGDEYLPFDVFPNSPGLLPWLSDDNGNVVSWLTTGTPDQWKTVFYPHSGYKEWFEYAESMTGFLLKAIQHDLDPLPWEDPFFTGPKSPVFVRDGDPLPYSDE